MMDDIVQMRYRIMTHVATQAYESLCANMGPGSTIAGTMQPATQMQNGVVRGSRIRLNRHTVGDTHSLYLALRMIEQREDI
jgi:hypothetical protein